jgi:molybdopterin converting factor small subunit
MRITIRYSAQARHAAGRDSEILDLAAPLPVHQLLVQLAERHSELRRLLLANSGTPHPSLLVFVGEEQFEPGSPRLVQDGEIVSILPPIAGGQS